MRSRRAVVVAFAIACACKPPSSPDERRVADAASDLDASAPPEDASAPIDASSLAEEDDASSDASMIAAADAAASEGGVPSFALGDPMANHKDTRDALVSLIDVRPMTELEKQRIRPDLFLRAIVGPDGPEHMNQGNKAIASHLISREQCLAGLRDVVLQTPEQRQICGADNMVPVWSKGEKAFYCIDVFEFPNKACELPMVWTSPSMAQTVCKLQGKRLCSQVEWQLACRADPDGGKDQRYAYGDTLDLDVCHTHRPHRQRCVAHDAKTTWKTCTTDTEPTGSHPKCRSRFGVYDQHGNVAEIMMRKDTDGSRVSQLKGSAWFYTELAREPDKPIPESTVNKEQAHPDHCNFDPRWHVEALDTALHVNYHLGFRCCKSL